MADIESSKTHAERTLALIDSLLKEKNELADRVRLLEKDRDFWRYEAERDAASVQELRKRCGLLPREG